MYCRHLSLINFRNYVRLELDLPPHVSVFWGDNGQGKSNLLEAVYMLATTRSFRTAAERELVNWHADTVPVFARLAADVVRHQTHSRLELILAEPAAGLGPGPSRNDGADGVAPPERTAGRPAAASVRRRVRINGHNRPPVSLIGHLNVVLFSPEDVILVSGPAETRRRYLRITLCQVNQRYLRTASRYDRVLLQRNALLREVRERGARIDQLQYWDEQLVELGADLVVAHLAALHTLNQRVRDVYPRLVDGSGRLHATYRPSIPLETDIDALGERAAGGGAAEVAAQVRHRFTAQLAALRAREQQHGITLVGPHRDDIGFYDDEIDLRVYGSRGQQRTTALALKLAEVALMEAYTSERPVLLLDDVMSELDPRRRRFLQEVLADQQQVLLTTTDLSFFAPPFLQAAAVYQVKGGTVTLTQA